MANIVIKIRATEKDRIIGHSNISKKLGDHTEAELINLGIIARESGNPLLLGCYEVLPTLAELKAAKTDGQLAEVKPATPVAPVKPEPKA